MTKKGIPRIILALMLLSTFCFFAQSQSGAWFRIEDFRVNPTEATAGDWVSATATIRNTGTETGTQQVTWKLGLDGESPQPVQWEMVTLSPMETTEEYIGIHCDRPGVYTFAISTYDEEQWWDVTVVDSGQPSCDITDFSVRPTSLDIGEEASIIGTIANVGTASGTCNWELTVNGESFAGGPMLLPADQEGPISERYRFTAAVRNTGRAESTQEIVPTVKKTNDTVITTKSVNRTLSPSARTDITFDYSFSSPGTYIIEVLTSDDPRSKSITVSSSVGTQSLTRFSDYAGRDVAGYIVGDTIYVTVDDQDENRTSGIVDTIARVLTVKNKRTFQSIVVDIVETGPDSGVFLSEPITTSRPGRGGMLEVEPGDVLKATYTDPDDSSDVSSDEVAITAPINQSPRADFDWSPVQPEEGQSVRFTDRSTDPDGYISSWRWDFGDGSTSTAQNPSHSYSSAGIHTVCLTVWDDSGLQDTACFDISVNEKPEEGQVVKLQGTVVGTSFDVIWLMDVNVSRAISGPRLQGTKSVLLGYDVSSTYWYPEPPPCYGHYEGGSIGDKVEVFGEYFQSSDQVSICGSSQYYVKKLAVQRPIARLSASPTTVKVGETVTFDASDSYDPDGQVASYYFDSGDGGSSGWVSTSTSRHSYSTPGTYYAKVKVRDNQGAESEWSSSVRVVVTEQNQPPIAKLSASPTSAKVGEDVKFDASASYDPDGTVRKYYFDFDDGNTSGWIPDAMEWHSYSSPGTYYAKVRVEDNQGLVGDWSSTVRITVTEQRNEEPVASFTVDPEKPSAGEPVYFDASSSNDLDGHITKYEWDFGDGRSGIGKTISYTYQEEKTYVACLTVTDDKGATDEECRAIPVGPVPNQPPVADFTWEPLEPEAGQEVRFEDQSEDPDPDGYVAFWYWDFGDDTEPVRKDSRSGGDATHTYKTPGDYHVCLRVEDNEMASSGETCKTMHVKSVQSTSVSAEVELARFLAGGGQGNEVAVGHRARIFVNLKNTGRVTHRFAVGLSVGPSPDAHWYDSKEGERVYVDSDNKALCSVCGKERIAYVCAELKPGEETTVTRIVEFKPELSPQSWTDVWITARDPDVCEDGEPKVLDSKIERNVYTVKESLSTPSESDITHYTQTFQDLKKAAEDSQAAVWEFIDRRYSREIGEAIVHFFDQIADRLSGYSLTRDAARTAADLSNDWLEVNKKYLQVTDDEFARQKLNQKPHPIVPNYPVSGGLDIMKHFNDLVAHDHALLEGLENDGSFQLEQLQEIMKEAGYIYKAREYLNCTSLDGHQLQVIMKHVALVHKEVLKSIQKNFLAGDIATYFDYGYDTAGENGEGLLTCTYSMVLSPAHLHAYDSQGRHTGIDPSGHIEAEIPNSYYSGPGSHPEQIIILGQTENITFEIIAESTGEFDLRIYQNSKTKEREIHYDNIKTTDRTRAKVGLRPDNPRFSMEIDEDGDGSVDEVIQPEVIETGKEIIVTIESALDVNRDNIINDDEIMTAIQYWINAQPVPGTNGQIIDDDKILELVKLWVSGRSIGQPPTAGNRAPTANFSFSPRNPNLRETIQFTDRSTDPDGSSDIRSWRWDFGDGTTSTAQNPTHGYSSEGGFTVTLTVTDSAGNSDSQRQDINVKAKVPTSEIHVTTAEDLIRAAAGEPLQEGPDAGLAATPGSTLVLSAEQYNLGSRTVLVELEAVKIINGVLIATGTAIKVLANGVSIEGVEFRNCGIGADIEAHNVTVNNISVKDCNIGVAIRASKATVSNNAFQQANTGVSIEASHAVVADNIIADGSVGIMLGTAHNVLIQNNDITDNGISGLKAGSSDIRSITIENNRILNNGNLALPGHGSGINIKAEIVEDIKITNNTIESNVDDGIAIVSETGANITIGGNEINNDRNQDGLGAGIHLELDKLTEVLIAWNDIRSNWSGVILSGSVAGVLLTFNNIVNNSQYGVDAVASRGEAIGGENNWWGEPSGPYHPTKNPSGMGDKVSDNVTFNPWSTKPVSLAESRVEMTQPSAPSTERVFDRSTSQTNQTDIWNDIDPADFAVDNVNLYANPISHGSSITAVAEGEGIAAIQLQIFDLGGKRLIAKEASGNTLTIELINADGSPLPNGVYICTITVKDRIGQWIIRRVRRVVVIR